MTTERVDISNIGLIVLSATLAVLFPIQLFLFAYAILGPLHYLTEINWLDQRNYFTQSHGKKWLWVGAIASAIIVFPKLYFYAYPIDSSLSSKTVLSINQWTNALIFLSILLAFGFVFLRKRNHWFVLIGVGVLGAILLNNQSFYQTIIGMFVPTVIHVFVFTLLFMIYGARKSKSTWGMIAAGLALVTPLLFVFISLEDQSYAFSEEVATVYTENRFYRLPFVFGDWIGAIDDNRFILHRSTEIKLMMFVSFIYTYHYLNWFSKTSLISWHKSLTPKRTVLIIFAWVILLTLFYMDYRLGFLSALFFSFLHVILEFPLNLVSIRELFKSVD